MRVMIMKNKIKCKKCEDIIESTYGQDFTLCKGSVITTILLKLL